MNLVRIEKLEFTLDKIKTNQSGWKGRKLKEISGIGIGGIGYDEW